MFDILLGYSNMFIGVKLLHLWKCVSLFGGIQCNLSGSLLFIRTSGIVSDVYLMTCDLACVVPVKYLLINDSSSVVTIFSHCTRAQMVTIDT